MFPSICVSYGVSLLKRKKRGIITNVIKFRYIIFIECLQFDFTFCRERISVYFIWQILYNICCITMLIILFCIAELNCFEIEGVCNFMNLQDIKDLMKNSMIPDIYKLSLEMDDVKLKLEKEEPIQPIVAAPSAIMPAHCCRSADGARQRHRRGFCLRTTGGYTCEISCCWCFLQRQCTRCAGLCARRRQGSKRSNIVYY